MQLAFVSPCFHDRNYGGVQYTARLAVEGLENGHGIGVMKVLCYGPDCAGGKKTGTQVCSHSKPGAILRALGLRGGPDHLLFWHLDLLKLLPFIGAGGKQVFLFLHGIECWRTVEGAGRELLDRVDVFLSNSEFTWQKFIEHNPQCATAEHRTVHLGVGSASAEPETSDPADVPAAAIVGRTYRSEGYKGHAELIQAWPLVLKQIPGAELWVVGGGDGLNDLKDRAAMAGVADQVRFFGVVSEEEKRSLIERSRCMVLPSRGEGFGLVYLEAMQAGRPCMTSVCDAGQEVIQPPEAGLAVDPADREALAAAVTALMTPGADWERRSSSARRRYEENFTAAHFQRRLVSAVAGTVA